MKRSDRRKLIRRQPNKRKELELKKIARKKRKNMMLLRPIIRLSRMLKRTLKSQPLLSQRLPQRPQHQKLKRNQMNKKNNKKKLIRRMLKNHMPHTIWLQLRPQVMIRSQL